MTTREQTYAGGTDRMAALVNDQTARLEVLELRAPIPGPKGDTGPQGPQGPPGPVNPLATEADHTTGASQSGGARYADGPSTAAYNATVAGGGFFAVWMDSGLHFARNTSALRFKENVRDHAVDPAAVLALRPVLYDRRDATTDDERDEYGLVADEVAELVPELVVTFDGQVDGVRYDLLAVALLDVCRSLHERITALEGGQP